MISTGSIGAVNSSIGAVNSSIGAVNSSIGAVNSSIGAVIVIIARFYLLEIIPYKTKIESWG